MDTQNNTNPNPTPTTPTPNHVANDKVVMGILSYLGPLVLIPLIMKKDDPFVKFHIKQGLVLLVMEAILWVLSSMIFMWSFWPIYRIVHLGLLILSVIGLVNATQGKEKELPLVGGFSKHFNI